MAWIGPRSVDGGLDEIPIDASGRLWLCGKRVVGPDVEAAMARAEQADTVVCMCQRRELEERYPDYVEWLDANDGGRALWFATPDLHAPSFDEAEKMATAIADRLRVGQGVIVHCAAGMGRAPTIAICAMLLLGHTAEAALSLVAENRPLAGPEVGSQVALVEEIARRVTG